MVAPLIRGGETNGRTGLIVQFEEIGDMFGVFSRTIGQSVELLSSQRRRVKNGEPVPNTVYVDPGGLAWTVANYSNR